MMNWTKLGKLDHNSPIEMKGIDPSSNWPLDHQTFQVPKMQVLTYISCMDTAYVRESPSPKQPYKVQYLHFRYLKFLVIGISITKLLVVQVRIIPY